MKRARVWLDPKFFLGLLVSAFFLFIAFYKITLHPFGVTPRVDFHLMWIAMTQANKLLLLAVSAQVLFMLFVRGHRWSLFLKPIKRVPWIPLGWSTCIGFAVNNLLPARLGEVARSISASRKTKIGFGAVFGTVVVERIYDTLSLLVLFVLSLYVWEFAGPMDKLAAAVREQFGVNISQRVIAINLSALVGLILLIVVLLKWKTELALRIAGFFFRVLPARWREKTLTGVRNFIGGLTQTTEPLEVIWILIISAGLWVISAFSVWVGLAACGLHAGATDAIFVLMSMAIAVSIPASPGYVGPYHFLAATAITLCLGTPWDQAMGAAIVIHLANYIPQTVFGLFALAREGLSLKEIEEAKA